MGYVNCETAKRSEFVYWKKNCYFMKKLKFSLSSVLKIGFILIVSIAFLLLFCFETNCVGYVNSETAKNVRICLVKKLSLYKEVALFSILIFENRFVGIVKY